MVLFIDDVKGKFMLYFAFHQSQSRWPRRPFLRPLKLVPFLQNQFRRIDNLVSDGDSMAAAAKTIELRKDTTAPLSISVSSVRSLVLLP